MDLNALLAETVARGGSDLHLKVSSPPMVRLDGALGPIAETRLTDADLERALEVVAARTPRKLQLFHESGDLDTAYTAPGVGRFRVNGFRQRGRSRSPSVTCRTRCRRSSSSASRAAWNCSRASIAASSS